MSSQPAAQHAIFSGVHYFITSSISPERAEQLSHVLNTNGATTAAAELEDPKLNTIISNSNKFEGWDLLSSREGVNIVTEQWVERSLVLGKVQSPNHYSTDPAMIFSGITACATDLPSGDLEVLSASITALGGQWRIGLTKEVTHLFALNTSSAKYATAMHFQHETDVKVIVPHWFDDAVRLGMGGLPTRAYEWPEPEVILGVDLSRVDVKGKGTSADLEKDAMKRSMYASAALFTAAMGQPSPSFNADTPMSSIMKSTPPKSSSNMVWAGRKFVLSRTLELYNGRRESLRISIEREGGVVVRYEGDDEDLEPLSESERQSDMEVGTRERIRRRNEAEQVKDCDVLITRWRYGRAYVKAFQAGKTIGTLAWLFLVHSTGVFTNPMDQIMHYPIPKRPIEGFSNHLISLTNYTGEAREYLKKLIGVMGAKFTPSMTGSNTALIAATHAGTKAVKAQAWSIPVVNHTWLEDCFVQWRNLTTATEKYIVFPAGVNFSEVLGERGVGVGKGVEAEVDDLASLVFEEDEVVEAPAAKDDFMHVDGSVQDEHEDVEMQLQMPNGTAGSAKEVELSLQDDDEEDHPDPKTSRHARDDSMDVDIVPSSTVTRLEVHRPDPSRSPDKVQTKTKVPVTPLRSPTKPVTYSSKTKQARKKIIREREEEEEEMEEEEEERVFEKAQTSKKSKPTPVTTASKSLSRSDQEDEEPAAERNEKRLRSSSKTKPKVIPNEVIELDDSDDSPPTKKQPQRVHPRKTRRGGHGFDDEEQEEQEVVKSPLKPKSSKSKPTPKASEKPSPKSKAVRKPATSRRIKSTPESEEEEVEDEVIAKTPSAPSKSKRKVNLVESDENLSEEEEEEEEEEMPKFKIGKPTGKRKTETKKNTSTKTKPIPTTLESDDDDDDDDDQPLEEPMKKVTPKKSLHPSPDKASTSKSKLRTGAAGLADAINTAATPTPSAGLLKKSKADARTRIKKKAVKRVVEEESDEEDDEKAAKRSKVTKGGRKGRILDLDAEESEGEGDTVKVILKGKGRTVAKPKDPPTNRAKPRRFHSSDEEEDPSDDEADEDDDDDSLPAAPHLLSKSESRRKGKGKAPPEDDTEAPLLAKQKSTKDYKIVASSSKRTMAVVIPSPKAKSRATRAPPKAAEEEESDQEQEEHPKSRKTAKPAASKSGGKAKAISPPSEEEVVPPKSRVGRGKQESTKKEAPPRRPAAHERKPSTSADIVDIDETPSASSTAPPRRNAATKARQHLHDTLMPDLVNFEAQMKKSKGKGRRSTSSYGAFALDSEPDIEVELGGKRKKRDAEDEDEDMADDGAPEVVENPKKKRRVSDQNDGKIEVQINSKSNGKRKGGTEDIQESRSSQIVLLTTQISLSEDIIKALAKLGVTMTSRSSECTHLIAPHIVRTEKFLCALARAPFIVTAKWATVSAASKKLLPEQNFLLSNEPPDEKYNIDLADALNRARANRGKMLEGKTFYVTPKVQVDKKLLKNVVGACGGVVSSQSPTLRIISNNTGSRFVISCKEDQSIWRPIADQGHKIYTQELLLMGVLKQVMEWDNKDFLVTV